MEQITISQLIKELTVLKQLHGDIKIYHIAFGSLEQVYSVKVETINPKKKPEKAVVLH